MKIITFLITLAVLLSAASLQGQTVDGNIMPGSVSLSYDGDANDTLAGTGSFTNDFGINQYSEYKAKVVVNIDTVANADTVNAYLLGSINDVDYEPIDTIQWTGSTAADYSFKFDVSTAVIWRYLRTKVVGTDSVEVDLNYIDIAIGKAD